MLIAQFGDQANWRYVEFFTANIMIRRRAKAAPALFGATDEDKFPRRIGGDAWFDRRDADRYEVHEQTVRIGDEEILILVRIDDEAMLG
jgi:hypothetical protein